tara:strand:- start:5994 stop:6188 length:195 start_codon:yes stop_codon:yes gene_type:complete
MNVSTEDFSATVLTVAGDELYLRIVPNGEGLSPTWYAHDGKNFNVVDNCLMHESVYQLELEKYN